MTINLIGLIAATFIASAVEAVEAATIVVALGTTRSWAPVLRATGLALLVLAVVSAVLGPAISLLPLGLLRLIVGTLLLVFGLQWLRKAVLRAAGRKSLNDENLRFQRTITAAGTHPRAGQGDPYAAAVAFKSVLLEGFEIVFIVVTFGANAHQVPLAAAAAVAAVVVVGILAAAIRGPLARVPENTLKFIVGIMLTGFGLFWSVEGTGADWPDGEVALPIVILGVAALGLVSVAVLRARPKRPQRASSRGTSAPPSRIRTVFRFVYDYAVGDDWVVAVIIVAALLLTFLAVTFAGVGAAAVAWLIAPVAVIASLPVGLVRAQR